MAQLECHFTKGSNLDTHRRKSFQPQKRLTQKEVKWIINAHYDTVIPPTWEYYHYYYCFGSISDKHFQTRKQGLLTQHHVTVTEILWNICVFSCNQDSSVSVSYRMDNWGITSLFLSGTSLLIFQLSSPPPGSNQLPIQWVLWILSTGHSADHSPSYALMKFTDKLTFTSTMCQCSNVHCTVLVHTVTQHMPTEATWYFDVNAMEHFSCLPHSQTMMAQWWRHTRAVRKVSIHFEYLKNRSCGLDVTWQPVRGDLTVLP